MNFPKLVSSKSNKELDIWINDREFTIGRGICCKYVFNEGLNISRLHCKIFLQDNEWYIEDLSSNGTFINNKLIKKLGKHKLKHGDKISLGTNYTYTFEILPVKENNDVIDLIMYDNTTTIEPSIPAVENEVIVLEDSILEDLKSQPENRDQKVENPSVPTPPYKIAVVEKEEAKNRPTIDEEKPSTSNVSVKEEKCETKPTEVQEEVVCSICTEYFVKATTLNCAHSFCNYCIIQWRKKHDQCPICRMKITSLSLSLVIDNIIARLVEKSTKEEQEERAELLKERDKISKIEEINKNKPVKRKRRQQVVDLTEDSDSHSDSDASDESFDSDLGTVGTVDTDDEDEEYYDDIVSSRPTYGYCFICFSPTHWAPQCPRRRRN